MSIQLEKAAQWLRDYADHLAGRAPEPPRLQPFEARQWAEKIDAAADEINRYDPRCPHCGQ